MIYCLCAPLPLTLKPLLLLVLVLCAMHERAALRYPQAFQSLLFKKGQWYGLDANAEPIPITLGSQSRLWREAVCLRFRDNDEGVYVLWFFRRQLSQETWHHLRVVLRSI